MRPYGGGGNFKCPCNFLIGHAQHDQPCGVLFARGQALGQGVEGQDIVLLGPLGAGQRRDKSRLEHVEQAQLAGQVLAVASCAV